MRNLTKPLQRTPCHLRQNIPKVAATETKTENSSQTFSEPQIYVVTQTIEVEKPKQELKWGYLVTAFMIGLLIGKN